MGASPGWYPDPSGGSQKRYWDGSYWHAAVPVQPGRPPATPRPTWQRALMIAAPILLVGGCAALLLGGGRSWDDVSQQVDAEFACQDAVTARLKHPDVAEFDHRSYQPASGSAAAEVRGVVKTVNGFNAPVRVTYGCKVSGTSATVTELFEP